jgi:hypothetical protein
LRRFFYIHRIDENDKGLLSITGFNYTGFAIFDLTQEKP